MAEGPTGPFSLGEKVLVPHTDKFYEAKVLKAEKRDDGLWYYLLHYTGWNKKWDEWVEETGLRRSSAAAGSAAGAALGAAGAFGGGPGSGAKKPKVRKTASAGDGSLPPLGAGGGGGLGGPPALQPQQLEEAPLELELPAALKKQLLDQYDAIHDDGKLLQLPRRPNVLQLFGQYVQYARDKRRGLAAAEEDLVSGLQVYFDKALYQCLLFKAERQQAEQVLASGQVPSAIYGAEHLLRLLVKMPSLLPAAGATPETLALLSARLEDLLTWMQHQEARIFLPLGEYVARR